LTWLRSMTDVNWFDSEDASLLEKIKGLIHLN
jgi:tRNA A37 N6-isopentenylltransferase MiaA